MVPDPAATARAVAWAGGSSGSPVVKHRPLLGGLTSTMLALVHADGTRTVLRLVDREPWAAHRVDLVTREAETLHELAASPVPAPLSLAVDPGPGRHLTTLLPGAPRPGRSDRAGIEAMAAALATVHDTRPTTWPRAFQSWAWEAKYVVPPGARRPQAWREAFDLLRGEPPAHVPTYLHRDAGPHDLLWEGDRVSGVVDWVETSTGPAWLDVAHAASMLALRCGPAAAAALAAAYGALTGRAREPWWEVMDVVGFLPAPGRASLADGPGDVAVLEDLLVAALRAR